MDPVVTARVPAGVRQRGLEVLQEIGSTTSELVNAAFAYVIQERELPKPKASMPAKTGRKRLGAEQQHELASFFEAVHIPALDDMSEESFERLFEHAMEERYADLR